MNDDDKPKMSQSHKCDEREDNSANLFFLLNENGWANKKKYYFKRDKPTTNKFTHVAS